MSRSCSISSGGLVTLQLPFSVSRLDVADGVIGICFLFGEGVALHLEQHFGNQSFPAHILQGFAAGAIATCSWKTRQRLRRFLIDANTDDDQSIELDAMERGETPCVKEHAPLHRAEVEGIVHRDEPRVPSPSGVTDGPFEYAPLPSKPNGTPELSTPMGQPVAQPPLIGLL